MKKKIDLGFVSDERLSLKAKGVLVYLKSKPKTWMGHVYNIVGSSMDGKKAVQNALKELRELGYVQLNTIRENGEFKGKFYSLINDGSYDGVYVDPRWIKKRGEILKRDGFKCSLCNKSNVVLQVHHLTYINGKQVWESPNKDLITLCYDCHSKKHSKRLKPPPKDILK